MQLEVKYNHLPYGPRFWLFMKRKKWVFAFLWVSYGTFTLWGNSLSFAAVIMGRSYKKVKKQIITHRYPLVMAWQTAHDTLYEPKNISRRTTDRLSELFLLKDRETPGGVTWQLVCDIVKDYECATPSEPISFKQFL